MRQKTVFVAVDGREFPDAVKARDHEERLFRAWLKDNRVWQDFINAAEGEDRKTRDAVIRDFWEWNYGR